jgi:hypothetical protein
MEQQDPSPRVGILSERFVTPHPVSVAKTGFRFPSEHFVENRGYTGAGCRCGVARWERVTSPRPPEPAGSSRRRTPHRREERNNARPGERQDRGMGPGPHGPQIEPHDQPLPVRRPHSRRAWPWGFPPPRHRDPRACRAPRGGKRRVLLLAAVLVLIISTGHTEDATRIILALIDAAARIGGNASR